MDSIIPLRLGGLQTFANLISFFMGSVDSRKEKGRPEGNGKLLAGRLSEFQTCSGANA